MVEDNSGGDSAAAAAAANGTQATFYQHDNYDGAAQSFAPGYQEASGGFLGALPDDSLSSLKVPDGLQVVLCPSAGPAAGGCRWYPPGDYPSVGGAFNDQMSSLYVLTPPSSTFGTAATLWSERGRRGSATTVYSPTLGRNQGPVTVRSARVDLGRSVLLCPGVASAPGVDLGSCTRLSTGDTDLPATQSFNTIVAGTSDAPPSLKGLDDHRLNDVTLLGSHNTYGKIGCNPANSGCDPKAPDSGFHYLWDALSYVRVVEIDVWADMKVNHTFSGNSNNCPRAGRFGAPRNQPVGDCMAALRTWHLAYPDHPFTIVKFEMKDGFESPINKTSPAQFDNRVLTYGGATNIDRSWIFTPADLMRCHTNGCTNYATPEAAARAGNWPLMKDLRGKFMFVVTSGTVSREGPRTYARALANKSASLMFPSYLAVETEANADPRRGFYGDLAPWAVIYDMQAGRIGTTIANATVASLHKDGFLMFISIAHPSQAWLPTLFPGSTPLTDAEKGSAVISSWQWNYGVNVVDNDDEKVPFQVSNPITLRPDA